MREGGRRREKGQTALEHTTQSSTIMYLFGGGRFVWKPCVYPTSLINEFYTSCTMFITLTYKHKKVWGGGGGGGGVVGEAVVSILKSKVTFT